MLIQNYVNRESVCVCVSGHQPVECPNYEVVELQPQIGTPLETRLCR